MTGWRIGYMGALNLLPKLVLKCKGQVTSAASSIAQRATKAAVEASPSAIKYMVDAFQSRRQLV